MISLKNYLFRDAEREDENISRRVISMLLKGIALHAVEGEKADHERFQIDMDKFEKAMGTEMPVPELLISASAVLRTMEDYKGRHFKFMAKQSTEMQNIVLMLTQTVINIAANDESSLVGLQDIEKAIESARELEDIQLLKRHLRGCLQTVREESLRQKTAGQSTLKTLKKELANSQARIGTILQPSGMDPAAGFPAAGIPERSEAEKAMEGAIAIPTGKFLLVAVVDRVHTINARFGNATGDQVIAAYATWLRKGLLAPDNVYQWSGPALIAVLTRAETLEQIRAGIQRRADLKLEKTLEVGMRTVLIPISAKWVVFPLTGPIDKLKEKIEAFTAASSPAPS
jgi:GGDEF domain-containing protein